MSGEPRYETAYELQQRIGHTDSVVCLDCGVFVMEKAAHTRFHSILSSHAWALAILKNRAPVDVQDRINSKRFDNWSADALAEVTAQLAPYGDPGSGEPRGGHGGQGERGEEARGHGEPIVTRDDGGDCRHV